MKQNYFYIFLFWSCIASMKLAAQEVKSTSRIQESAPIEGLNLYPNPVTTGKVYISTKNDLDKEIQIFDVLGKRVLQTVLSSRELNVNTLSPGVYIIKIREEEATTTRKLIIR